MSDTGYAATATADVVGTRGTHVKLDMSPVRNDADGSVAFLDEQISRMNVRRHVVVFLGEEHGNATDQAVTQRVLKHPPLMPPGATRVIFERGLDGVYFPADSLTVRTERMDFGLRRRERSTLIARMIKDAFEEHDMRVVYVPCGSAHRDEIFEDLERISAVDFTFISKASSTD